MFKSINICYVNKLLKLLFLYISMFIYTFQIILISLVLIILGHYLYNFFKDTLTIPKTKDLVNSKQYQEIIDIIKNNDYVKNIPNTSNVLYNQNGSTSIQDIPNNNSEDFKKQNTNIINNLNIDKNEMKNELKNFLKNLNSLNSNDNLQNPLDKNPFATNTYTSYM